MGWIKRDKLGTEQLINASGLSKIRIVSKKVGLMKNLILTVCKFNKQKHYIVLHSPVYSLLLLVVSADTSFLNRNVVGA